MAIRKIFLRYNTVFEVPSLDSIVLTTIMVGRITITIATVRTIVPLRGSVVWRSSPACVWTDCLRLPGIIVGTIATVAVAAAAAAATTATAARAATTLVRMTAASRRRRRRRRCRCGDAVGLSRRHGHGHPARPRGARHARACMRQRGQWCLVGGGAGAARATQVGLSGRRGQPQPRGVALRRGAPPRAAAPRTPFPPASIPGRRSPVGGFVPRHRPPPAGSASSRCGC